MNTLNLIFFILICLTLFVSIVVKVQQNTFQNIILVYLIVWGVFSFIAIAIYYILKIGNNLFIFHLFVPISYIILSLFFYNVFEKRQIKKAIKISALFFTCISFLLTLFVQPLVVNNSYAVIIEAILVIVWVLLYLHQVFISNAFIQLHTKFVFWVSTGLLIHFVGKLFIQGTLNYLIASNSIGAKLYSVDYFFDYILLISINIGVLCKKIFKAQKTTV